MLRHILTTAMCSLMLLTSTQALSHERGHSGHHANRHHHDGYQYRSHKKHRHNHKRHKRHDYQHHRNQHRRHHVRERDRRHRRHNDAALFVGGAILGAALNSHLQHRDDKQHRVVNNYSYRRNSRGNCFRVEHQGGREVWTAVSLNHCEFY